MFEQAVLSSRPSGARFVGLMAGFTGQVILIGFILLAPLVWPQLMPRAQILTWISLPSTPPAPVKAPTLARAQPGQTSRPEPTGFYAPTTIPDKIPVIEDLPAAPSVIGGTGVAGSDTSRNVLDVIGAATAVPRPVEQAAPKPAAAPAAAEPATPIRVTVGGNVRLGRLVRRVEPAYPVPARIARISGVVELSAVVGTDGHVHELKLVSGHPFLARAAIDAVRQWIYEPTFFNGMPVEVISPIRVTFTLN